MTGAYALHGLGQGINRFLPIPWSLGVAQRLARFHGRRSEADRAAVRANLRILTGWSPEQIDRRIDEVFENFARYLVEFFNAHRLPRLAVTIQGYDHLAKATSGKRGAIILSAHVGNWELGAILLSRLGWDMTVVALPHGDPRVNRLFDRSRRRCGVEVIPLGEPGTTRRCLHALHRGTLVGLAGDRTFGTKGFDVMFFGRRIMLPRGPALLSVRTGAAILPVFVIREAPWQFRLIIESPIGPAGDLRAPTLLHELTQQYATAIEGAIRRFPTQWLMFQSLDQLAQPASAQNRPAGSSIRPSASVLELEAHPTLE